MADDKSCVPGAVCQDQQKQQQQQSWRPDKIVLFPSRDSSYPPPAVGPIILFLAMAGLYNLYRRVRPRPVPPSLPGPKRYPLVGILPHVINTWEDWPEESVRLSEKYGRTWGGPVPNVPGLNGAFFFVVDEASIRHVLDTRFENYEKGPAFRSLYGDLLGQGIFATDGDLWRVHRKIASNMFSRNLLRRTSEVTLSKLEQVSSMFFDRIRMAAEGNGGIESATIDIQDILFRMTFDTTSYVAFGCEMDSTAKGGQHPFAKAFDEMQLIITERMLDPLFKVKRRFGIGSRERRIFALKQILADHAASIINGRRRSVEDGCKLGPDLLSRFLDYAKKNGQPLHDEELRDVVMNILLAGRDTTACALSWAFYELTRHPRVVGRILEEVKSVCGSGKGADYSYDAVCQLRYTHAVVMEVLRLHPSVTNDHKYAVNDDVLPDGTFVPAGAAVAWMPIAMGRSKRIWGEDSLEFKPERFLDAKEPSLFKYPVFNAGPRVCLGKPLALMTMKLTLAYLLPRFDFADKQGHSGAYRWTLVRAMKGGFAVEISKREEM